MANPTVTSTNYLGRLCNYMVAIGRMTNYCGRMTKQTKQISERIEAIRRVEGMSVAALAESAGIADKTLRRRLLNPEQFSLAELIRIASILHVDVEELLVGRDDASYGIAV